MNFSSVIFKKYNVIAMFCIFLILLILPVTLHAAKPKAADLVEDGQLIDLNSEKYKLLFSELKHEHKFTDQELQSIFKGQKISRRVLVLMDTQWEAKPYYKYYPLFITDRNIAKGREQLRIHKDLLDRVEEKFGVEREIIVAIWAIESRYGANMGTFNVLRTLSTLFYAYPRRAKFFRTQLIHFLVLCRENGIDPHSVMGSYAGAFGQTQFIPSSFNAYAVSFDGDDKRDAWNSVPDVLASIANYLKEFHWTFGAPVYVEIGHELKSQKIIAARLKGRRGRVDYQHVRDGQNVDMPRPPGNRPLSIVALELPPGSNHSYRYVAGFPNFQAITHWNHSNRYAMAVTELAESFRGGGKK
jgi:membrane-bound lytic murein transglycosylase B